MDSARAGAHRVRQEGDEMPEHRIGTRGEWQARDELARLEAEQAERNEGDQEQASRSPLGPGREGVRVRQRGGQEDPRRPLRRALTAARLQRYVRPRLHARRLPRLHRPGRRARRLARPPEPPRRDLLCFSRAPIERLTAYKRRMGWQFPYVSTCNTDFAFDLGLALTEEQAQQIPEV